LGRIDIGLNDNGRVDFKLASLSTEVVERPRSTELRILLEPGVAEPRWIPEMHVGIDDGKVELDHRSHAIKRSRLRRRSTCGMGHSASRLLTCSIHPRDRSKLAASESVLMFPSVNRRGSSLYSHEQGLTSPLAAM